MRVGRPDGVPGRCRPFRRPAGLDGRCRYDHAGPVGDRRSRAPPRRRRPHAGSPDTGAASAPPTANPAADALAAHPWATAELTDVTTGETFTIADLAGKPLFIEAMAIWCTNCRQQQGRFTEAFGQLLPGMAEYVVLTIDPSETANDLARYEAERGFTGRYVVAGRELSRQLIDAFGPNILNPPSVPLVFVSPTGEIDFRTGPESVDKILERAGA